MSFSGLSGRRLTMKGVYVGWLMSLLELNAQQRPQFTLFTSHLLSSQVHRPKLRQPLQTRGRDLASVLMRASPVEVDSGKYSKGVGPKRTSAFRIPTTAPEETTEQETNLSNGRV